MIAAQCVRRDKHHEHRWIEKIRGGRRNIVIVARDRWCEGLIVRIAPIPKEETNG